MDAASQTNHQQSTLWNGLAGRGWVEAQDLLDRMFKPLEDLLVEAVCAKLGGPECASRVLDVGCGTGSTTLAVARLLGAKSDCIGIDISEPMIAAAQARAERGGTPASFIHADAQVHAFEPASFDLIVSRFGVMFFDNSVQAFANLRRAASDDAELRCVVWRSPAENPFMTTAERAVQGCASAASAGCAGAAAAAPLLLNLPARQPNAPGQFAFADPHRVHRILQESGWAEIDIRPIDVACTLPEKELVGYLTRLGPVGRALQEADEKIRTQVIETVRAAFDPYVHGDQVRFNAACWIVGARVPFSSAAPKEWAND